MNFHENIPLQVVIIFFAVSSVYPAEYIKFVQKRIKNVKTLFGGTTHTPERPEQLAQLIDSYEKNQIVVHGKYKVIGIKRNPDDSKDVTVQSIGKLQLERETFIFHLTADLKEVSIKEKTSEYTLLGKIAVGAAAQARGAYLAVKRAVNYPHYLYKKATPWLNSLYEKFQTELEKFGFAQSD